MIPGFYIVRHTEDIERARRFDTVTEAKETARPRDVVVFVGDDGKEHYRWKKTKAGTLRLVWVSQDPAAMLERVRRRQLAKDRRIPGVTHFLSECRRFAQAPPQ